MNLRFFPFSSSLPSVITSYDLLKILAVVTMVIDHLGVYFFPDLIWMRAVGRASAPIWLFLIGYARSRDITALLLISGGILLIANSLVGLPIFPLNILFTIAATRFVLDRLTHAFLKNEDRERRIILLCALVFLIPFTDMISEYGTLALLFALMGYLVRNIIRGAPLIWVTFIAFGAYGAYEGLIFGFSPPMMAVMVLAVGSVIPLLYWFDGRALPPLEARLPKILSTMLRFCGRRTLLIYVVHLLLFKILTS